MTDYKCTREIPASEIPDNYSQGMMNEELEIYKQKAKNMFGFNDEQCVIVKIFCPLHGCHYGVICGTSKIKWIK